MKLCSPLVLCWHKETLWHIKPETLTIFPLKIHIYFQVHLINNTSKRTKERQQVPTAEWIVHLGKLLLLLWRKILLQQPRKLGQTRIVTAARKQQFEGAESTKSKNNVATSGSTPDHYIHLLLRPRHFGFDGTSAGGCASDRAEVNGSDGAFLEDAGAKVDWWIQTIFFTAELNFRPHSSGPVCYIHTADCRSENASHNSQRVP